jgi:hypothetical protein
MLKVQEYLKSGKSLDDLHNELAIELTYHPTLPLVILNYSQIDSPKTDSVVRECRGLVLNKENWSIVAKAMNRFFNWGEVADEMPDFNWNNVITSEKVDGSLCLIYYFDGKWRVNTRGSFAGGPMLNQWTAKFYHLPETFTWQDGILRALQVDSLEQLNLDPALTYVGEFCSLWNKVVRAYNEPCIYLLTCYAGEEEVGQRHPRNSHFRELQHYKLDSALAVQQYVSDHPESTFEGCVVKDDGFRRWKIKNPRYIALHHLKGNDNIFLPKYALPFLLKGEYQELVTYFPEAKDLLQEYQDKVDGAYDNLENLWRQTHEIPVQKDFALSIVGKTPFTGILFNLRKKGVQSVELLKQEWRSNPDLIVKVLFK